MDKISQAIWLMMEACFLFFQLDFSSQINRILFRWEEASY